MQVIVLSSLLVLITSHIYLLQINIICGISEKIYPYADNVLIISLLYAYPMPAEQYFTMDNLNARNTIGLEASRR